MLPGCLQPDENCAEKAGSGYAADGITKPSRRASARFAPLRTRLNAFRLRIGNTQGIRLSRSPPRIAAMSEVSSSPGVAE